MYGKLKHPLFSERGHIAISPHRQSASGDARTTLRSKHIFGSPLETTWLIANKRVSHTREGGYPGGAVKKKRGFLLPRE